MSTETSRGLLARFLVLTVFRWLPVGLLVPMIVLIPLDRGIELAEIGTAFAFQGFVVLFLELPAGAFADALGRRPVLIASGLVAAVSLGVLLMADTFALLVIFAVLQGIHRALDSGPLESWYVDAAHAIDPKTRIESGMSAHGTALGLSVAGGAILSGGLVAWDPPDGLDALVLPIVVSLALIVLGTLALIPLMTEHRDAAPPTLTAAFRGTPAGMLEAVRLVRGSHILAALIAVELFWGFGIVTFESLMPIKLADITGGTEAAATITGPAVSAAWVASAAGAALAGWMATKTGTAIGAAILRLAQGGAVIAMALSGGIVGVLTAYLACYAIHGASNPLHVSLLHKQVSARNRATVLSLNSMVAQPAGALGLIVLTGVAEGVGVSTAMVAGGIVLAAAAPLYVPAWRQERAARSVQPVGVA